MDKEKSLGRKRKNTTPYHGDVPPTDPPKQSKGRDLGSGRSSTDYPGGRESCDGGMAPHEHGREERLQRERCRGYRDPNPKGGELGVRENSPTNSDSRPQTDLSVNSNSDSDRPRGGVERTEGWHAAGATRGRSGQNEADPDGNGEDHPGHHHRLRLRRKEPSKHSDARKRNKEKRPYPHPRITGLHKEITLNRLEASQDRGSGAHAGKERPADEERAINAIVQGIAQTLKTHPHLAYTVENPKDSALKNHHGLASLPGARRVVKYCCYGTKWQKQTSIWTNLGEWWRPKCEQTGSNRQEQKTRDRKQRQQR